MIEQIDLSQLVDLKLHIEKIKANNEVELKKLTDQYDSMVNELTETYKDRLKKSGELYDSKNDVGLVPIYADREVNCEKLYTELPDKYWEVAHISPKNICEYLDQDKLEDQIYTLDTTKDKTEYRKLATVTNKDLKPALMKHERDNYWLPRKILKYDLDIKIK